MWKLQLTYRKVFIKNGIPATEIQNLGFFCFKSKEDAHYLLNTYYNLQHQRGIIQIYNGHECDDNLIDIYDSVITDYHDLVRAIEIRKNGH